MIADLLTSAVPVASDILERTASTPRVQQIVSLSLAPAFLLAAIGAIMLIARGLMWSLGSGERTSSSIIGVASGQSTSPPRVRSSAFFMGPISSPNMITTRTSRTAAIA